MPRNSLTKAAGYPLPNVVFVLAAAAALQAKCPLYREYLCSRNLSSMRKISTHVLSTSRKHKARSTEKSFECYGHTVLMAVLLLAVKSLYSCSEGCPVLKCIFYIHQKSTLITFFRTILRRWSSQKRHPVERNRVRDDTKNLEDTVCKLDTTCLLVTLGCFKVLLCSYLNGNCA